MTQSAYPVGRFLRSSSASPRSGAFRSWACINAQSRFVILGPGSLLALVLIDWGVELGSKGRFELPWYLLLSFFAIAVGMTLYGLIRYAVVPLLARIEIDREALVVESLHGSLDNQIIGSLQLGREVVAAQASGQSVGYSTAIVSSAGDTNRRQPRQAEYQLLVDRKKTFQVLQSYASRNRARLRHFGRRRAEGPCRPRLPAA